MADHLRGIPAVHRLVEHVLEGRPENGIARALVTEAARATLEDLRAAMAHRETVLPDVSLETLAGLVMARLEHEGRPPLAAAINGTGIIVHTGLGRAPWPEAAVRAAADAARSYAPVEIDMASGRRGRRSDVVRELLVRVTGAESGTVVNNNAAALMIVLSVLAKGRSVIVSRGELIEIGGSFRLPQVMAAGGAVLRAAGTTNRTRLGDYREAIDETTAVLLSVHTSNYRVEGFTEAVPIADLVALGRERGLPVVHDVGSGLLERHPGSPVPADEPAVRESIDAGADLVLFSGDKLLGGPQAGLIVGRADLVGRIEKHPLMRALRVDKVTLAALAATLQVHRDPERARREVPVLALLETPLSDLERRAAKLAAAINDRAGVGRAEVRDSLAFIGGGAVPTRAIPSRAIVIEAAGCAEHDLARRLRTGKPGVLPRVTDGIVWIDLRTVTESQDGAMLSAITTALDSI